MNKRQIERYFKTLSELYPKKCSVILTGAAAGALYGRVRATMDIDFAATARDWDGFAHAVGQTSSRMGIEAQFAEDIDRWSTITLMDYGKHSYLYKRFESVEVRLMEPAYWAIGKWTRYLDSDVQDIVSVFKKTQTPWREAAFVAGTALRKSPKSTACFLFRRQVEVFFKQFGNKIWGKGFVPTQAIEIFHHAAGIKQPSAQSGQIKRHGKGCC